MLDPEDRRLEVPLARPREQHDQQLGIRAVDPHRLLDSERPHPRGGGRDDPLSGEALRARVSLPGERLRRQHRERGEHPRGVGVAARLERLDDRRGDLRREPGLGERDEQGGGQVLQLGRVLERRRVLEQREELRDDLLAQDV